MNGKQNLAARAGRWSAAHWKTATLGWVAFVVVAVVLGKVAGTVMLTDAEQSTGEAARAQAILQHAGFSQPAAENVLVQSRSLTVSDPAFRTTIERVAAKLRTLHAVQNVRSPFDPGGAGAISKDRHSALVQFSITGDAAKADTKVQPVLDAVDRLQAQSRDFTVAEFGFASANKELSDTLGQDFRKAELLSVPITFLILLFAFGAFVAAGVPVLLAFTAVLGSIGIAALISHASHASDATNSVMLLMGMAVGVDYSLFYLKREREERIAGAGEEALPRAAATSGQAVLISGGTVLIAMAGMLLAGSKIFTSIGMGTMIVVFTSMVGSVTVLPALLAKLGDRVERGVVAVSAAGVLALLRPLRRRPGWLIHLRERRTFLRRLKGDRTESRIWGWILRPVLRFPAVSAALAVGGARAARAARPGIHTKLLSFTDLPRDIPIVKTFIEIQRAFPGAQTPAQIVVQAPNVRTPAVQSAIASLEQRALATGQMFQPVRQFVNPSGTVVRIEIPLAGNGDDAKSVAALQTLRSHVLPPTIGKLGERQVRRHRRDRRHARLQRDDEVALPARLRVRARTCISALAPDVQVDRRAPRRDRAQPALGRRRLRRARLDLPGRPPPGRPQLPLERRDHHVAAALPVHRALRTLDGLPRVHRLAHQGARRSAVSRPPPPSSTASSGRRAPSRRPRS